VSGSLVVVPADWLDLVGREAPELFALPRADRFAPMGAEAGDPWFLAVEGRRGVSAAAEFVEHELLSAEEAFDRFGYGTGGLSLENIAAQLRPPRAIEPDELLGWVSLRALRPVSGVGPRELAGLGVELPAPGEVVRLSDAQAGALAAS
jgi:hypothetical protein